MRWVVGFVVSAFAVIAACSTHREEQVPTYRDTIAPLAAARCVSCHSGDMPAGAFRADSYLALIGCVADGRPASSSTDSPLLAALARPSHAAVADTRGVFERWIRAGTPNTTGGVHPPRFSDPRADESHGRFLRARQYRPMLQANDPDACGACHEGAPLRGDRAAAPGATACTTCHTSEGGALGCNTCHGVLGGAAHPPRDACFFGSGKPDSHAAHVGPSSSSTTGVPCGSCHPVPKTGEPGGTHADGYVEVWLANGKFENGACATRCHAGPGGKRPQPKWGDATKMTCNDCHGSPPPGHFQGPCSNCHREANADGTALISPTLHMNGKVDVGEGSGRCGSCHGTGDDPWPSSGAHKKHQSPASAARVACINCHPVPGPGEPHPRGDGKPIVRLAGIAAKGGRTPTFDVTTKTCTNTYCHYAPGATLPAPKWTDGAAASGCGACHSSPPPPPHPASSACGGAACHAGTVSGGALTPAGSATHVDGRIQL